MSKRNLLVTFSGIDSAGKSTYIAKLEDYLNENNVRCKVIWSRGGYTNGFEFIKKVIRKISGKRLPSSGASKERTTMFKNKKIALTWYIVAMIDLIRLYSITIPLYKLLGYTIICDRYIWDTYVDFSFIFSEELNGGLWKLLEKIYAKPNISYYFYISAEESLKRSDLKNEPFSEPLEKRIERIIVYRKLMEKKKWSYCINTEKQSIDSNWLEVRRIYEKYT